MTSLASVDDLSAALRKTVDNAPAELALRGATAAVIAAIGWDPRESPRTYARRGRDRVATLFLPVGYLSAVTSVTVDGATLTADVDYTWSDDGVIYLGAAGSLVQVSYVAGWPEASIPDALRDACLTEAMRRYDNPRTLRSWTTGSESETYAGSGPALRDDPILEPYRLAALA